MSGSRMDGVIGILQYALPAGFLASVITWLIDRKLLAARSTREKQAIFKEMYNEIKEMLAQETSEKNRLYRVVSRLERAVSHIGNCRYVDDCPVRHELRKQTRNDEGAKPREYGYNIKRELEDGIVAGLEGATEGLDGEPA